MKKIIELANEVCNDLESQDGIWLDSAIMLRDAINVRRKLEQTPITEDWLKEHGWEVNHHVGDDHNWDFYNSFDGRYAHIYLHALCKPQFWEVNYSGNIILHLSTLADLYDACELCGITMD